ncbi:MAG: glycosyltransferase [Bacteroidia bacterium]|nr:glycosyltransferase [Bacteroidia bacterium]
MSKDSSGHLKLNIVFLGESYLGGMAGSKRIQNLINSFLKIDTAYISNLIIHDPNDLLPDRSTGEKNAVKYEIISYNIKNPFSFFRFYLNALNFLTKAKNKNSKNILYCYDNPTFFNYPILWYAKKKNFKIVVDIVEDYSLAKSNKVSIKKAFLLNRQKKLLLKLPEYAAGVLAISTYLKNSLVEITKHKVPVMYLPATVNFSYFSNSHTLPSEKIKIFYGGSFGEKDGLLFLLSAFDELAIKHNKVELVFTGKPPKAGMKYVTDHISNSKYKDRIHYLGYLNDEEYYKVMNSCDIFCMTRVDSEYAHAGFPFKLGEMLATGKPVIATNISNVSDYLANKQNAIIIQPSSVNEIVLAIEFVLTNPEGAANIGKEGRKTAMQFFDTDVVIKDLNNFLIAI